MSAEIVYGVDFRAKSRTTQSSEQPSLEQQAADLMHQALFGAPLYFTADLATIPHYHPDKDPA